MGNYICMPVVLYIFTLTNNHSTTLWHGVGPYNDNDTAINVIITLLLNLLIFSDTSCYLTTSKDESLMHFIRLKIVIFLHSYSELFLKNIASLKINTLR